LGGDGRCGGLGNPRRSPDRLFFSCIAGCSLLKSAYPPRNRRICGSRRSQPDRVIAVNRACARPPNVWIEPDRTDTGVSGQSRCSDQPGRRCRHRGEENDFILTKNTSFEIVAKIETGDKAANGVIVAQGGAFGGWSLYVKDGTPIYAYNYVAIDMSKARVMDPVTKLDAVRNVGVKDGKRRRPRSR